MVFSFGSVLDVGIRIFEYEYFRATVNTQKVLQTSDPLFGSSNGLSYDTLS